MRFGSMEDFSKRYLKYKDISLALNVKESTLRMLIKKFRDNDFQFVKPKYKTMKKLTSEAINFITS